MPLTAWRVLHDGQEWGAGEGAIIPAALAAAVQEREGQSLVTNYGKPYVIRAADPQSVYDYFNDVVDPDGDRTVLDWQYVQQDWEKAGSVIF